MQRKVFPVLIIGICLLLLSACATPHKTYERGWVGGQYLESSDSLFKSLTANYFKSDGGVIPALPEDVTKTQSSAVFVSRVFENTPLSRAGIRKGDLIVAIQGRKVESLDGFRKIVDQSKPGEKMRFTVYRDNTAIEVPVVAGRETYQKWHYFSLGFRLGTELDPIPTPDFNILGLISFTQNDTRLELNSPEYQYYLQSKSLPPGESDRTPESKADAEGWDAWFVLFGLSGKKIIVEQQS